MKKLFLVAMTFIFGISVMAQQKIQLRSADKAECVRSDMKSLKASFSFSTIEAQDYQSERGTFSWLRLANTVIGGNEGDPQLPVINQLIAVPFGANPSIEITSYSATDYRLEDYGMHTLMPRQLPVRKSQHIDEVPFIMNEAAYQTRGLRSEPTAIVSMEGTMRGVQLGKMTIEPVSYDPVNNTIRVFNDIEVTVHFDGADARATEQMLIDTYSPYFEIAYKQLFNGRAITDIYTNHPDLYNTPVKMLVVTTSTYANSTAFQNWLTWKKQKGIYVDVQTVANSASASTIKNLIYSRYNANHPSFLVLVGDETVVTHYSLWDYGSSYGNAATDLEYASVDGDIYHDMYMSRMPVSSTTELGNLVNKILTYEKYTMSDPSYLNETLLIAGWDSYWTPKIGKPTIQYANNNYFNSAHGITPHVFITTASNQRTCYNYINNVGFVNYTAHGDIQEWADPSFTNSNVNSLTNNDKYFWAMGNCCLTANFKNQYNSQTCFGEAMIRAANKGAWGYIGSVPESIWYEDYYFGVGAFNAGLSGIVPSVNGTTKGAYDALFDETSFNCLNSVPFIGNLAVSYAHSKNYTTGVSEEYYWRAYMCFGDGSVMPYVKVPAANNVSHANTLPLGATSFNVTADAGSYVAITVNNEIIGVAVVPSSGTVSVPITAQTSVGTALIVVTRNQRQPYIATVNLTGTQYTISASASPTNGGTVSGAGTYYEGTNCTLTATPNTGYSFTNWKKGNNIVSTEPTYTFTVTSNASYTATFTAIPQYTIDVTASPSEGGAVSGGGTFYSGTECTLTATANAHYEFINWKNGNSIVSTNPTYTFTVTAAGSYVAYFNALAPHTVTCNPVENGTISATPTTAYKNETVSLTATPASGYFFSGWDVRDANNNSITVVDNEFVMPDSDVTVSAAFVPGYNVTLATPMNGSISANPVGGPAGTTITLTATPDMGYVFNSWIVYKNGDLNTTVTVSNNSFTMPAYDVTVVGIFTEPQGGDVTIGSGNTTNSGNYVPTSTNYEYSLTQQIYTADELGEAANIIAISFYYNNTADSDARNLNVYMSHTNDNTITSWSTVSSSQLVYSGFHTFTQGWNTLTLTTPFAYNGTSNILLTVDDNTGAYLVNGFFRTYSTGVKRAIWYRNSSTNPDPTGSVSVTAGSIKYNAQMIVTKAVPSTEGYLCVSPNSLNSFEAVSGGEASESQSVAVIGANLQNELTVIMPSGYEVCTTETGEYSDNLTLTPIDGNLRQMLYVRLSSNLDAGEYNGSMTLACGTTTASVTLEGQVISNDVDQVVTLPQGASWWSTNLDITLEDLKAAIANALGSTGTATIKSQTGYITYSNGQWSPSTGMTFDLRQMYMIQVSATCTFTLTGVPVNPSNYVITIHQGATWIGFPSGESMTVTAAFAGLNPENGDVVKGKMGNATFNGTSWIGGLTTLEPGQGYIYLSKATSNKTFIFGTNNNK